MRLMCPNCDAEYEVAASAIPVSGRDVQCSNCGHAWFQNHPDLEADQDAEAALYDPPPPLTKMGVPASILPSDLDWQLESDDPEAILDAMGREAQDAGADAPSSTASNRNRSDRTALETQVEDRSAETGTSENAAPLEASDAPKRDLDPEALRILREEVELETAQRALEQGKVDPSASPVIARRVARLKGIQPPAPNPAAIIAPQPTTPSARLPKIETVSESLRKDEIQPKAPKPKSGRGGAITMFFLALVATAAYVFSPDLSARVPDLAQPLVQYVGFVDGLRDQLDILLPKVIAQGNALIALVKGWF